MARTSGESLFDIDGREEVSCNHIIRVAFDTGADGEFDYLVPDELWPVKEGQRVEAFFGRGDSRKVGFCVNSDIDVGQSFAAGGGRLKRISKKIDDEPLLDRELLELGRWISDYYVCPLGQVLSALVPAGVKKGAGVKKEKLLYLSGDSEDLCGPIKGRCQKKIITFLRDGGAFSAASAISLKDLLAEVGCGGSPVKKLAQAGVIKTVEKMCFKQLPAIPQGLTSEAEHVELNSDQEKSLCLIKSQIDSSEFGVTVLHGVTDSGKTEVYIKAIDHCISKGRTAIVLLPEIALTAQTVQRFSRRFERIAVLHSALTASERNGQWQLIKAGKADVVIGARSAIFAPVRKLGLVVVDEEHEPSYKQDTVPRYNGRDVAIKRAQLAGAVSILGSATPSLETLYNSKVKKYFKLSLLPKRVLDLPWPEMRLVDMRSNSGDGLISELLADGLERMLSRGEQGILLLNRRGYSSFIFCPSCKHSLHCRNCDVTLTFHKKQTGGKGSGLKSKYMNFGSAICHYCGAESLVPRKCPLCGKGMTMLGLGSQMLEEQLRNRFSQAVVARVDSDTMSGKDYYRMLADFSDGRIDILCGTQMLAKGLHFPNVTVVGIISTDTSLYLPDFRSNERTFQLICQVAGRAGRSSKGGRVYVQSFLPEQPAIEFALKNDFSGFVSEELKHRKMCNLPPYWRLACIVLRDRNYERLEQACGVLRARIDDIVSSEGLEVKIRGPMPCVISRVQGFHRMQIIVQGSDASVMGAFFTRLRGCGAFGFASKVAIDIDPVNLL